jgi:hypothetical protein
MFMNELFSGSKQDESNNSAPSPPMRSSTSMMNPFPGDEGPFYDSIENSGTGRNDEAMYDRKAAIADIVENSYADSYSSGASKSSSSKHRQSKRGRVNRKETMKLYMRDYRKRQKKQMETMSREDKQRILDKQRQRVRERVRRHRMRKKLLDSGVSGEDLEHHVSPANAMAATGFSNLSSSSSGFEGGALGTGLLRTSDVPLPGLDVP